MIQEVLPPERSLSRAWFWLHRLQLHHVAFVTWTFWFLFRQPSSSQDDKSNSTSDGEHAGSRHHRHHRAERRRCLVCGASEAGVSEQNHRTRLLLLLQASVRPSVCSCLGRYRCCSVQRRTHARTHRRLKEEPTGDWTCSSLTSLHRQVDDLDLLRVGAGSLLPLAPLDHVTLVAASVVLGHVLQGQRRRLLLQRHPVLEQRVLVLWVKLPVSVQQDVLGAQVGSGPLDGDDGGGAGHLTGQSHRLPRF